jgi:hypothetical protein
MNILAEKRQPICPYFPPELWQRILFQHTHPKQLWVVGRQVCSTWRSEIPKLFAKKYLENPNLVQIWLDFGEGEESNLIFDRYEGGRNERVVFKERPAIQSSYAGRPDTPQMQARQLQRERVKTATWSAGFLVSAFALQTKPPWQVRIKTKANDTELPGLRSDAEKRELSFGWEGIFAAFYSEAAMSEKPDDGIVVEASRWLGALDLCIGSTLTLKERKRAAKQKGWAETERERKEKRARLYDGAMGFLRGCKADRDGRANAIRRDRIRKKHFEICEFETGGHPIRKDEEVWVLERIDEFETEVDYTEHGEDAGERRASLEYCGSALVQKIRGIRGLRECDEEALLAMFMKIQDGMFNEHSSDEDEQGEQEWKGVV